MATIPIKHAVALAVTTASLAAVLSTWIARRNLRRSKPDDPETRRRIKATLPPDLPSWRLFEPGEGGDAALWAGLQDFLKERGYTFWPPYDPSLMRLPLSTDVTPNGYGYAPFVQGKDVNTIFKQLFQFTYPNPSCQAAQAADGRSVVIRVLAMGESGRDHIRLLRSFNRGPPAMLTYNHAIPLLALLDFDDITFGVFPLIGGSLCDAYEGWAMNSVGDIMDMFCQCLEALHFLHLNRIAHRDAFKDNFLVQWHPETLRFGRLPASRPRVFLNDFETAVRFPFNIPNDDCVCIGNPTGASFPTNPERYLRPVPPELLTGTPYDPFKLDVWQLSHSFEDFRCNVLQFDDVMEQMRHPDPAMRPAAHEVLNCITSVVQATPPEVFMFAPTVLRRGMDFDQPAEVPPASNAANETFVPVPTDASPCDPVHTLDTVLDALPAHVAHSLE